MSEDNLDSKIRYPFEKGVDVPFKEAGEVYAKLKRAIKDIFSNTNLVEEKKEIKEEDISDIYKFYDKARQINPEVFNPSIQEHLIFTERYASLLGQIFNSNISDEEEKIDINKLRAGALLHDLGRTFSHRRARNDRIEEMLLAASNVREDIKNTIPPDSKFVFSDSENGDGRNIEDISDIVDPPYPALVVMADVLAKKVKDNGQSRLRRWEDVVSVTKSRQKEPDASTMWPSEYARQEKVVGTYEYIGRLYDNIGKWFEEKTNVSLDKVVELMEDSLRDEPLKVDWSVKEKIAL